MHRKFSCGFTLIELLVVIDIIVVLSAILFPVFAKAREKARQTVCISNEKQIGLAFQQYVSDNDDCYPIPINTQTIGYGWAGKVMPYVKSTDVFKCPDEAADSAPQTNTVNGKDYTLYPVSYAWNGTLGITDHYQGENLGFGINGISSRLNAPTKTVLLLEVGGSAVRHIRADLSTPDEVGGTGVGYSPAFADLYAHTSLHYAPFVTGYMGGSAGSDRSAFINSNVYLTVKGRHSDGANYLLCDGHAKWLRGDQVSTGAVNVGSFPDPTCATQETSVQDPPGACADFISHSYVYASTAAGTASSEPWAATWSPI